MNRDCIRLLFAVALRSVWFLATLAGAMTLVQVLLWASPGDPIDLLPNGEELRPALEKEWGLDKSPAERVVIGVGHALAGDLGTSLTVRPGASVREMVERAAARSVALLLPALVLGVSAALALAWFTAGRSSVARRLVQALSIAPVFLLAYMLVVGLNSVTYALVERGVVARPHWFALPDQPSMVRTALAIVVLAVGSGSLTEMLGACEDELVRVRSSGFVDAARARGAPTWPHVLLNLVPPLATIVGTRVTFLVGGLVILEKVLMLNGAGSLLWQACLKRDYPLAMGLTLVAALAVCGARLLSDLVRVGVDPRLRGTR